MRRALPIIVLLLILFLAEEWVVTFIKQEHAVTYEYVENGRTYQIDEKYRKKEGDNYYLDITTDGFHFSYIIPNDFRKNKEIVKELATYEKEGTLCIFPIFDSETISYDIECSSNGSLFGYEARKQEPMVQEFIGQLKERNIQLPSWEEESLEPVEGPQGVAYTKNIPEGASVVMWTYQGIDIINQKGRTFQRTTDWDKYDNNQGILVNQYYVQPLYHSDRVFDFSEAQIINIENPNDIKTVSFPDIVSQNTYINGVVEDKIYYLDKDKVVQYELNLESKKVRVVGNTSINAQFYNGKWDTVNIYDMVHTEMHFQKDFSSIPALGNEEVVEVFENSHCYYYYTRGGAFYRLSKETPEVPMYLFQTNDPSNVRVENDTIYYISGDSAYCYREAYGNRKIITNNEFLYNKLNRIYVYEGEKEA